MNDDRTCVSCGQLLSRYNDDELCAACQTARRALPTSRLNVPPAIWLRPEVRRALSQWDWSTVLAAVLSETGASQTQLAEVVGLSQPHVSRLVTRTSECFDIRTITQLVDALGAPRLLAGLAPATNMMTSRLHDETAEEVGSMRRRAFLASPLALPFMSLLQDTTEHVDLESAISIRQLVPQLYTLDDQAGGDLVTDIAMQCLNRVDHLLNHANYAEDAGHELMGAFGELNEMTGWTHFDNGRYESARFYLGEALRTAQLADDLNLEVLVLASMNVLARYQGRPREALQVIQLAQRRAVGWAPPRLTSLLAAREAVCKAQLGDASGSRNAMHRAYHAFHPDVGIDDPSWIAFFSTAELTALRASASGYLGDMEQAAQHMRSAVEGLGPKFARNRAYYSVRVALFAANHGDLSGGIDAMEPVLPLFHEVKSRRAHVHLHKFVGVAASSGLPKGRTFADNVRALGLLEGNS